VSASLPRVVIVRRVAASPAPEPTAETGTTSRAPSIDLSHVLAVVLGLTNRYAQPTAGTKT
jgi:hypothetical protein